MLKSIKKIITLEDFDTLSIDPECMSKEVLVFLTEVRKQLKETPTMVLDIERPRVSMTQPTVVGRKMISAYSNVYRL